MKTLILCALCATSITAHAEFWDGNKLYERMNGIPSESLSAGSYVAGVADALVNVVWCPPPSVTLGQVKDMAKMALEQAPEKRHLSADLFVSMPLAKAWPCKAKQTGNRI